MPRPGTPQVSKTTKAIQDSWYLVGLLLFWWVVQGEREREIGPGLPKKAATGCFGVFSQFLVPFNSPQLLSGCNGSHSFVLLLSVYALGYLGNHLQLSTVGAWASHLVHWSLGHKGSCLFCVLILLKNKEWTVYLEVHTCNLPTCVYFPDTERVAK